MKVAIIGYGNVGMMVFNQLLRMPEIHQLVLCGRNRDKIDGELADFKDFMALYPEIKTKVDGGGYEKTAGADVLIYAAGPPVRKGCADRMSLAEVGVEAAREVSMELNKYNNEAAIVVISNPVDILVSAFVKFTGRPREKVIGTGTMLDTARFARYLAEFLDLQPRDIVTYVLGEHGDSACIIWSWTKLLGMTVDAFLSSQLGENIKLSREKLQDIIRRAGLYIFERKGSTSSGVAAAAARIVSALLSDTHEIMPVSVVLEGEYGISGVALSVPCFVDSNGATVINGPKLSEDESRALEASAEVIRKNMEGLT